MPSRLKYLLVNYSAISSRWRHRLIDLYFLTFWWGNGIYRHSRVTAGHPNRIPTWRTPKKMKTSQISPTPPLPRFKIDCWPAFTLSGPSYCQFPCSLNHCTSFVFPCHKKKKILTDWFLALRQRQANPKTLQKTMRQSCLRRLLAMRMLRFLGFHFSLLGFSGPKRWRAKIYLPQMRPIICERQPKDFKKKWRWVEAVRSAVWPVGVR